ERFFKQYNIGWIVCWTNGTTDRLKPFPGAEPLADLRDQGDGVLFRLDRIHSYALVGQATLRRADSQRIVLDEVKPENGRVILSLHYQKGMQVSPSRVQIEPEKDAQDPVNFVRLYVPDLGPVACIMITWEQ